ncbi:hypothetical protein Salat_0729600 [Sesamum alatum]|uniref:Uncharacterized protein n=1 Tax=Sesamum alatum TaxID=300844 RepID=A0AAE1YTC2_9LAMI|nr:hypothetical protein Salat_0729600 [Sesamum alatum]
MAREGKETLAQANKAEGSGEGGSATLNDRLIKERDKIEDQILKMEANVFQLANYYFVFQGVILTAIIKGSSSSLKCNRVWLPFCMSVIASILNFIALGIMADKYKQLLNGVDTENVMLYQYMYPTTSRMMRKWHQDRKKWRTITMVLSMGMLSAFAVLSLLATWIVPCWD